MRTGTALRWAGIYLGMWILVTVIAGGLVAAGLALNGLRAVGLGVYTPDALQGGTAIPAAGIVLIGVGALVFQFGTAVAGFKAGVGAIESETAKHFDPESMKSDILAVLDDRLADMHQEISQTRQLVNRMGREDASEEFEFGLDDEL